MGANANLINQWAPTVTSGIGAATSAYGALGKSKAAQAAYNYEAGVAANNAEIARWQEQDAIMRGAKGEQTLRLKSAQLKSSQRASLAARGLALDEGSPLDILTTTDLMTEGDVATLKDNTQREAWGFRVAAGNANATSELLKYRANSENPWGAAGTSLLTGAGNVHKSWTAAKKAGGGSTGGGYSSSTPSTYSGYADF